MFVCVSAMAKVQFRNRSRFVCSQAKISTLMAIKEDEIVIWVLLFTRSFFFFFWLVSLSIELKFTSRGKKACTYQIDAILYHFWYGCMRYINMYVCMWSIHCVHPVSSCVCLMLFAWFFYGTYHDDECVAIVVFLYLILKKRALACAHHLTHTQTLLRI